jgi:hypothetical protein
MAVRFIPPLLDVGSGISPASGALLYFFEVGTNTPKTTYTNEAGTIASSHPIVANAQGVFAAIFIIGDYDVRLNNKNNVLQWGPEKISAIDTQVYCSNIAVLKTLPLSAGVRIATKGYYVAGDAGWANYLITSVSDGFSIPLNNGNYAEIQPTTNSIKGEQFGCRSDNGVTENNVLIRKSLLWAATKGVKKVTLNNSGGWFGLEKIEGSSVVKLESYVDFIGIGVPELKPIVNNNTFMEASIFLPGNYHPSFFQSVPKESVTLTEGSSVVTVADSSSYVVGELVFVTSQTFFLAATYPVYTYMEVTEIVEIVDSTKIRVNSYIEFAGAGYVAHAENNGVNGRFGIPLFFLRNSRVSGFKVNTLGHINGDSATYHCEIDNISGNARTGVYGNAFTHTRFHDWNVECYEAFSEMSFCSHNNSLKRIRFNDDSSGLGANSGLSWQESGRHNVLDGFEFVLTGTSKTSNPIRIQDHQNTIIKNGVLKINGNSNSALAVVATTTANVAPIVNSGYDNVTIIASSTVPVAVDVNQTGSTGTIENCFARNIIYKGVQPSVAALRLRGNSSNKLTGFDCDLTCEGSNIVLDSSNTISNQIRLAGDYNATSINDANVNNDISIFNISRSSLRSLAFTQGIDVGVTSTSSGNIVKTFTIPLNSMELTDSLQFEMAFTTAGTAGTKTVQIGYVDGAGAFQSVNVAATGENNGSLSASFDLRTKTFFQILGFTWYKGVPSGSSVFDADRLGNAVADVDSNNLLIQVRAWVASGDSININKMIMMVNENGI